MKNVLIILHGWRSSSKSFEPILEYLDKNIEPVLFDLPGFGDVPLEKPYTLEDYLKFLEKKVEDEINKKNFKNFYLLGHSFGGAVALLYALSHPQKIKALILYNPAIIREKNLKTKIIYFFVKILKPIEKIIPQKFLFLLKKAFYHFFVGSYDYFLAYDFLKETFKNIQKDLREEAKMLKTKTYLLWGKKDRLTPLKHGYLLRSLIKDSDLIIFDGGHSFHKENPKFFSELINRIIRENENN